MRALMSLPLLGDLIAKIVNRFWPDKSLRTEKTLDIELEELRQSGGRITPRMLLKYIVACGLGLYIVLTFIIFFFPEFGPLPEWLHDLLPLAGTLFGLGE